VAITQGRIQLCLDLYKFYQVESADSRLTENTDKPKKVWENIRNWRRAFPTGGTDSPKKANVDLSCFSNPSPIFCLEFVKPLGRQEGGRTFCDVT
jgi:hypothetical protein